MHPYKRRVTKRELLPAPSQNFHWGGYSATGLTARVNLGCHNSLAGMGAGNVCIIPMFAFGNLETLVSMTEGVDQTSTAKV